VYIGDIKSILAGCRKKIDNKKEISQLEEDVKEWWKSILSESIKKKST